MGLFDNAKTSIGSLFNRAAVKQMDLSIALDADPGLFYEIQSSEGPAGHALFKVPVKRGPLTLGPKIPMACMFEAHWLLRDGQRVGFSFTSQFQVENSGGYLLTYVSKGAGKATVAETLVKTDDMVVFNYPNRGTLVLSPKINDVVDNIFQEQ